MELTQDVFAIHCDEICAKIEAFLREKTTELRRDGIVVPISGGLDSSVVVSLCVRAAGKDHWHLSIYLESPKFLARTKYLKAPV